MLTMVRVCTLVYLTLLSAPIVGLQHLQLGRENSGCCIPLRPLKQQCFSCSKEDPTLLYTLSRHGALPVQSGAQPA